MTQGSPTSGDQVLVECSSLPPPLRNDLQAFLEHQPEVRAVTRKLRVSDALLNTDTVGIVAPRFDLVVHLAEHPQASTAESGEDRAGPILKKVAEWTDAHRLAADECNGDLSTVVQLFPCHWCNCFALQSK